jgi:hypothetical protein
VVAEYRATEGRTNRRYHQAVALKIDPTFCQ